MKAAGRQSAPTVVGRGRLEIVGGRITLGQQATLEIANEVLTLGRDASCTLMIDDPRVSAIHADVVATARGVRLRDLGSRNGTFVDGVRITEALLTRNHMVMLDEVALEFEPSLPTRSPRPRLSSFGALFGESMAMRTVFEKLARVAPTELSVLLLGETGTGKELAARGIHEASSRRDGPFVVVDCGSIPESLAESFIFGHERGAFTGADSARSSPFELASGGTIFLDELGELPLAVQTKLLRVIAERRIKPVGGSQWRSVDVRLVAATRVNLARAVNDGAFRSDLYFRIAQMRVDLPPLRERREDLPGLVSKMVGSVASPRDFDAVSSETLERLMRHDWPGNVRELRNAVEVACALSEGGSIEIDAHLSRPGTTQSWTDMGGYHEAKRRVLERFEHDYFAGLVAAVGPKVSKIAELSGLARPHVRRYLRVHGLKTQA